MTKCGCGCGARVEHRFVQGHNARLKPKQYNDGLTNQMRHQKRLRENALVAYGGQCACCGETEVAFLVIDHINNDGAAHRREIRPATNGRDGGGYTTYRWLRDHHFPSGFQVLCANCNMAKGRADGCPHLRLS